MEHSICVSGVTFPLLFPCSIDKHWSAVGYVFRDMKSCSDTTCTCDDLGALMLSLGSFYPWFCENIKTQRGIQCCFAGSKEDRPLGICISVSAEVEGHLWWPVFAPAQSRSVNISLYPNSLRSTMSWGQAVGNFKRGGQTTWWAHMYSCRISGEQHPQSVKSDRYLIPNALLASMPRMACKGKRDVHVFWSLVLTQIWVWNPEASASVSPVS